MKVGDVVPVTIGGHTVANATVRELGDGTATLVVPGTLVVMATRTTLDDAPTPAREPEKETIITGVDRASGGDSIEPEAESSTQEVAATPEEVQPAQETQPVDEADSSATSADSSTNSGESEPTAQDSTNSEGHGETQ